MNCGGETMTGITPATIPVDLNRLRDTTTPFVETLVELSRLHDAVLDAPQVWWCAGMKAEQFLENITAGYYLSCAEPHLPGCGWVALVPVVGP